MSGNSAKRSGIETEDPDLEERLRRIEVDVEKRQLANVNTEQTAQRRNRLALPQVTGVVLDDSVLGAFSVNWQSVDANINRYELQLADNSAFANPATFKVNVTSFILPTTLDATTTYYVRVRGVGTRVNAGKHAEGEWSSTLSIAPGQATFNNLQTGAAGNIIKYEFFTAIFPVLSGAPPTQRFVLSVPAFNLPTGATCLVNISYQYLWQALEDTDRITITTYLDGEEIGQFNKLIGEASIGHFDNWQDTIAMLPPPQLLEAGEHRVKLKVELSTSEGASTSVFTTQRVVISVLEVRR